MRSKRGHQNAHAPGRDSTAPKWRCPIAISAAAGSAGSSARKGADEFGERRVDRRSRDRRGRGRRRGRSSALKLQDMAGVNRVGSRSQVSIALPKAGAGVRPAAGAGSAPGNGSYRAMSRPSAAASTSGSDVQRIFEPDGAQHGVEPQQPARRHGRHALVARGARQCHFRRRDRLDEIMRGHADGALRHGDARIHAASAATSMGRAPPTPARCLRSARQERRDRPAAAAPRRGPRSPAADGGRKAGGRPRRPQAHRTTPDSDGRAAAENRPRRRSARCRTKPRFHPQLRATAGRRRVRRRSPPAARRLRHGRSPAGRAARPRRRGDPARSRGRPANGR